ncbi:MAG TPA: SMC-Scp complex subunit ScpB [Acidimicrobiales bacterium]|jgi:segregation and condensation protein B|nr:SMC-Scp complex subunit ScpB [Acidimicrobiales bacterium]
MPGEDLGFALEAMVLVAIEPVTAAELADLLDEDEATVVVALGALRDELAATRRGFQLQETASGWRLVTHPEAHDHVQRFANRDVSHRLSTAALETLAIVAYRQPVSRVQIGALRGVNADGVVRLLEQRGYIEAKGRAEGPGQPVLFGTTELFLDRLGLRSLDELPPIAEFLDGLEEARALAGELAER